MTEKIKNIWIIDLERLLLNNLTRLSFYLILLLISLQIFYFSIWKSFLSSTELLTFIWAILIFWYWYKKYERDKEIQLIELYSKNYNEIKTNIYNLNWVPDYKSILNLWYEEYYLYHNWYISEKLWKEWCFWIEDDIKNFISYEKLNFKNPHIYEQIISLYWKYNLYGEMAEARKIKKFTFFKNENKNFFQFVTNVIKNDFISFNEYRGYLEQDNNQKELKNLKHEIIYYNEMNDVPWYFKLN